MKIAFCPGYVGTRNCDARCDNGEHHTWSNLPESIWTKISHVAIGPPPPVAGYGSCGDIRNIRPVEASGQPSLPIPGGLPCGKPDIPAIDPIRRFFVVAVAETQASWAEIHVSATATL